MLGIIGLALAAGLSHTEALAEALKAHVAQQDLTDESRFVAKAILDNFIETRSNAARWSAVYWGFTFVSAVFGAVAGLILKVESILQQNEKLRKDIAAALAVGAALLITLSTSGDFQRKWQANRVAASELEQTGYAFLENSGDDARQYYADIGNILHKRNLAIVGNVAQKSVSEPNKPRSGEQASALDQ